MNLQEAAEWAASQEWVYARSYSKTFPHYYTTRSRCKSAKDFEAFLWCIRRNGRLKQFFKKQYIYLELSGLEFWEMGRPIPAVQVLNKAPINDAASYRNPPPSPEEDRLLKQKLKDREVFLAALLRKDSPSEREQKQIKFLMDSQRRVHGGGKNIVDHSSLTIRYE